MTQRKALVRVFVLVLVIAAAAAGAVWLQNGNHAKIDAWSGQLSADQVEWAEAAQGYGVERRGYTIPAEEYEETIAALKTVTEAVSSRKRPAELKGNGYRLAMHDGQKLWLFQCYESGKTSLTFEDAETAAYYGCEDTLLYIDSPALWNYIVNTVDDRGTK